MRICAIICEFNPFHNGHKYLLEHAREISGADAVLCIMSGSFTQRGEMCVLDKYTRARHAVLGGADAVIQLPAPFAVAPAEVFARGAVKILSSIPAVKYLSFGCESENTDFASAASLLLNENDKFKHEFSQRIDSGESYIKSYGAAFAECGGDSSLLDKPNNILGLEYAKAVLRENTDIKLLPVKRVGSYYNDGEIKENYSSATAIRNNRNSGLIKSNLPDFVYKDLIETEEKRYDAFLRFSLFSTPNDVLNKVYGCSEGLENKLKTLTDCTINEIIENATSKRYSSSRIRRILLANALKLYRRDCEEMLDNETYIRILAVKNSQSAELLPEISKSTFTVLAGNKNLNGIPLSPSALKCVESDKNELATYNFINGRKDKESLTLI